MKRFKNLLVVAVAFVAIAGLAGCTTFSATGLSFLPQNDSMEVVGHFSESKWVHEFLGMSGGENFLNISAKAMEGPVTNMIWNEINKKGGNGAINISIKYGSHIGHWILNKITCGIWAPAKLTIKGDVVKIKTASVGLEQTEEAIKVALANFPEVK